ncbi:MAG: DNA polymerase III subunit epsilon [Pseudomonadales bacterium]|nr:DNA polymerase III subunit epsilon [Pseudomonadales bacterium]
MRQIVLDTETTGLEVEQGNRIIEIGAVELINRKPTGNHFHQYINPERDIEAGALAVHGLSEEFLNDKPVFASIGQAFLEYIDGAELIIHNAPFDLGFLNMELTKIDRGFTPIGETNRIIDSLVMARRKHPGQKNNLDALCRRYQVDNSSRELHGALLDAEILADVYLRMTGGQVALTLDGNAESSTTGLRQKPLPVTLTHPLRVVMASTDEDAIHQEYLETIDKKSDGNCLWSHLQSTSEGSSDSAS